MKVNKPIIGVLGMLPLVGLLTLAGYNGALAATLDEKLAAGGTADDHLAAAMLYQDKARELTTEAAEYEAVVAKIGPYEDTKGFRRGALRMAAQEKRHDAQQMQQLYAAHLAQAQVLHGKVQPQ